MSFTCCHPPLAPEACFALTLREVCGLATEGVANAFLITPRALARQEPERHFLARRLEESKKSPFRMSISSVRDDYRMNDPARNAVLLARRPVQDKYAATTTTRP
jgi:hypothetical protein